MCNQLQALHQIAHCAGNHCTPQPVLLPILISTHKKSPAIKLGFKNQLLLFFDLCCVDVPASLY
jgi:hypothetical protein